MWKLVKRLLIGIIVVIILGYLLLITPLTQQAIKNYVLRKITADTSSVIKIGAVRGSFSSHLILENIEFKMNRVKLTARKISIKYHPNLLLWGNIIIDELEADGTKIKIYPVPADKGLKTGADPVREDPWIKYIEIKKINLGAAEVEYNLTGQEALSYKNVNISAAMYYDFLNSSMKLNIAQFGFISEVPALSVIRSSGEIVYTPYDLRISGFNIKLPRSSVYVDGMIKDFSLPKIYLKCKSDRFYVSDVPVLKKQSAVLDKPMIFDLVASGDLSMLRWILQVRSGQARFSGRGIVDLAGTRDHSFTFNGELNHLDLAEFGMPDYGDTDFNASIQGMGRGNKSWDPEMQMTLAIQDSYFGPYQIYPSEFMLSVSSATVNAATNLLNTNFGHFVFQCEFKLPDLASGIAAASVSLQFDQFNLKPFLKSMYLGSNLNGSLDLTAKDFKWQDPARSEWSATVDITKSNLAKIAIDRVLLEADFTKRKWNITKGHLVSDLVDAEVNGYYEEKGIADLQCRLEVKDLSLAANIFPEYPLTGKISLLAKISGLADNPEASWQLNAQKLKFERYLLSTFNCAGSFKDDQFEYELAATGKPNQSLDLKGTTRVQKTRLVTNIELLKIQFLDQVWTNAKVFQVQTDRKYFMVDDLIMGNRGQVIRAKGVLDWKGAFDFSASLENLQLGYFNESFSAEQNIGGDLNSFVFITGNAAQPVIKARIEIGNLGIRPVCFEKYSMELDYQNGKWELRGLATCQSKAALDIEGSWQYPLNFDQPWPDIWDSTIDLKVKLDKLPLDLVQTMIPAVTSARGYFNSAIEVKGTLRNPDINILANTTECDLKLRDLPKPFIAIKTKARVHNKKLDLEYLMAEIENGQFSLAGTGEMEKLQLSSFDLILKITNAPVFYPGIFNATVDANGSFKKQGTEYILQADVAALEGIIEIKNTKRETQTDIVYADELDQLSAQKKAEQEKYSFYDHLAMDFKIHSEGNLWYKLDTSKAELVGDLRIQKQAKGSLTYLGSIRIKQGYYDFLRNRFVITHGELQFPGTVGFNPLLNIDGEYKELSEIMITATVRGDLNNPLIQLHSDPPQKDVEILSYLLFGKSSQNLSTQEASSVESQVFSFIGRSTVLKVRDILGDKLTIDTLDIKRDEKTQNWRVSVGKYIGRRLFVSYTFGFSADAEDKLRLEYKLSRRWNIESEISQKNAAGADLFWTIDY
ncbi:MAG: translocation/assembly module TamB [bacterium]|nr:translocation/assembly module TamB [bacterium]